MNDEEKARKFEEIQEYFWAAAAHGSIAQSALAAVLIRELNIPGPNGEDPEAA